MSNAPDLPDGAFSLPSHDGTGLYVRHFPVPRELLGRLLWVHGFAEHGGRYTETLNWFAERGYESWIVDLRGHGLSEGKKVHIHRFSDYLDDMEAYYAQVATRLAGDSVPLFSLGHSMGGLVLSRLLQDRSRSLPELSGAVILSPFMEFNSKLKWWQARPLRWLSRFSSRFSVPAPFSTDVLSKDPEVGNTYRADPLISRRARARWFIEAVAAQSHARAQADQIKLPLLVMHGLDDNLACVEATKRFFDGVGSEDRELKLWNGLRHELLNEVEKEQVREHICVWLEGRIG